MVMGMVLTISEKCSFLRVLAFAAVTISGVCITSAQPIRPDQLGASPLPLGEPGIAWYTTLETGKAEAKRSNRPIMFVAAATQCRGVSGVF